MMNWQKRAINKRAERLRWCTDQTAQCHDLAQNLIQTVGTPYTSLRIKLPGVASEHERARGRLLRVVWLERAFVFLLRASTLNSHLIQTAHHLKQLHQCCRQCTHVNRQRLKNGQPFQCLVSAQGPVQASPFRYQLNEQGQIIEHD